MQIALTGVTGHLGAAVLRELLRNDHGVNALIRSDDLRSCVGLPVRIVKGDLHDESALHQLMSQCDALIHCAGLISVNGDPKGLVHQTNVEGARTVMEVARQSGIKRVIHISSIHAFQQRPSNEMLDEKRETVNEKATAYDRSKKRGQQIALSMNGNGMEVIVMNPTSIIGPYDFKPSRMGKVIMNLYNGRLPFVIDGGFDYCDNRDVAQAIVNGLTRGTPGECYLLPGKWHSLSELPKLISNISDRKIKITALPVIMGKAGLPFVKFMAWLKKKEPLYTNEALEAIIAGNRYISSAKAVQELNYSIRPMEETLLDTLHWFQNMGYLV